MLLAEPESFDFCLSMCSNAVQPLPLDKINNIELSYPLGIADYEEIFGKKYNKAEYLKAHSLFVVGKDEPNEEKGFDNMNCVVVQGGHNYGGKGNLVVKFTFNNYTISTNPRKRQN